MLANGLGPPATAQAPWWVRHALEIVLVGCAVPRLVLAATDQGIFYPDEIFQSLEQAHRMVFGYGCIPWEFQEGARSWLLPGTLGVIWKAAALMGVSSATTLVVLAKGVMVAMTLAGLYAAMRLAKRLAGLDAALLTGLLGATFPGSLIYGHRCMSEVPSAALIAFSTLLIVDSHRRALLVAGGLATVTVFLHPPNGVFALSVLVYLVVTGRRMDAAFFVAGGALGSVGPGLLDWWTWGQPFHSVITHVQFNLLEDKEPGVWPLSYYVETAWTSTGAWILIIAVGAAASWRRARGLVSVPAAFVVVHSMVVLKQYRFVSSIVPVLLAMAGVGLVTIIEHLVTARAPGPARSKKKTPREALRKGRRSSGKGSRNGRSAADSGSAASPGRSVSAWALALGAALSTLMGFKDANATFASTGQWADGPEGRESVWHHWEGVNRSLWDAGTRDDLCGVLISGMSEIWSGGYSYLHRDVPLMGIDAVHASRLAPFANYLIGHTEVPAPSGYVSVRSFDAWSLFRRDGACAPPPPGYSRKFWNPRHPPPPAER